MNRLRNQLERHEGVRDTMYLDSVGAPTIGMGHNLRDKPIPQAAIDIIADADIADAIAEAERRWPWITGLTIERQNVIINMTFNMGGAGVERFVKFLTAARAHRYDEAAAEMLDSKWARQVGARANELAMQFRTSGMIE